ncbi:MAG: LysR family transcriptional regulator [Clostridia bacterium]|nr:LysR family transcriptional regulator [Clostridia bacterium]
MEIYPLLYFVTIAQTGNLTQAAKQLNISPPALSNAIKRLEQQLETPLFDRVGRSILLNDYGKAYLPYAEQIISLTHQGNERLHQMKQEEDCQLAIADLTHVFASHLISEFLTKYPEIRLHRSYLGTEESKTIDLEKTFDFAIGSTNLISRPDLCNIPLRKGKAIVAIVNNAHPLAAYCKVTMRELVTLPMIAYATGQPGRRMLESLFNQLDAEPLVIYEGNTPDAMGVALSRNLGVLVQPAHTAQFNMRLYPDCVSIPITDATYHSNTSLFWSTVRPQSKAAKLFSNFCIEYCTTR